jgi:hypothetical protein
MVRHAWLAPGVLVIALVLAAAGAVLVAARAAAGSASAGGSPALSSPSRTVAPAAASTRLVCSFSNEDAAAAMIQGADGGASIVAGGRTWWFFGDTLFLPQSGKQIEANSIAWSQDDQPGKCPRLSYHARDGIGVPFLQKDGSLTVWPSGTIAVADRTIDLYVAYVYGSGPYAYWIGEIGVARLDTRTMRVTILNRSLWTAGSGFPSQVIGAQPVDDDAAGNLRLVLQTHDGGHLLARVPRDHIADPTAYEYWDGAEWSADAAAAAFLWPRALTTDPIARLATFDNGASIAFNAYLGKYVAVGNVGFDKIGARVADRLEGPWSEPVVWIDCSTFARPAVPTCYSPFQHPQLAADGGRTLFLTFTRMAAYDVVAFEVTLDDTGSVAPTGKADAAGKGARK